MEAHMKIRSQPIQKQSARRLHRIKTAEWRSWLSSSWIRRSRKIWTNCKIWSTWGITIFLLWILCHNNWFWLGSWEDQSWYSKKIRMNSSRAHRWSTSVILFINGKWDLRIKNAMCVRSTSLSACSSGLVILDSLTRSTTKRGYGSLKRLIKSKTVEYMVTSQYSWVPFSTNWRGARGW